MTELRTAREILDDPTASDWLKSAINTSMYRDPIDSVNDADFLLVFLRKRAAEALKEKQ